MTVWSTLNPKQSWDRFSEVAKTYNLDIGDWKQYDNANLEHTYIRIGFAAHNDEEIYELINRLKKTVDDVFFRILNYNTKSPDSRKTLTGLEYQNNSKWSN
ncbi:MAG: hypothetical protein AB8B52_14500 [Winogradskyella sp.]|uniref:hypothetical protein n=1 Tax=Winogradskyella sp. TaxID=1883156 RepID=UPI00385D38B2